ncbi:hypothetical protein RchiOBHm_Chr6g0291441 [Rosa chinensis]|uniref:Bifunctional inhibitor/plant lipid transfer protein/seed storage helical n=1 Tax=Rosa chinensis TaxID=74649 RepID=A0A2P6PW58_ROSCH|nr:annexin B11 [Rosa chinensis]PRQ26149.1 hypothetical protein RchiOBHm_Chr6g0291441 [Rosa chinensis]
MMERVKKILTLFAATLLLLPIMEAQHYPPPRSFCASQFALASYACSLLPYTPMPTPQPPAPSPPDDDDDDNDDDDDDDGGGGGGDDGRDGGGDGGRDGGGDRPEHGSGHGHGHHHGHGHNRKQQRRHRHRHGHHHRSETPPSPQEENCCKWLSQLDNQCVCELLLRLPTFLLKPAHTYSLFVGSSCNVKYTCAHP